MSWLSRRRTTVVLLAVALACGAALVLEVRYLAAPDPGPTPGRPVVAGEVTQRAAVRAASVATSGALSYGYEDFDAQVASATETMTAGFAREYRRTAAATRQRFAEERATQEVRVVGSAVVSASDTRATALLFLDQRLARAGAGTSVSQYRALATVERQDGRWLLAAIRTG